MPFLEVSKLHALVKWKGDAWYIEDLSTNGTRLNKRYIDKAKFERLELGDKIEMAGTKDACWEVVDLGAPENMLISAKDSSKTLSLDVYNLFPNEDHPEFAIQFDSKNNVYRLQDLSKAESDEARVLEHGERLLIAGEWWECFLPQLEEQTLLVTKMDLKLASLSLDIDVSQDEESIAMRVHGNGVDIDFGIKAHHYLVCHLARQKLKDAAKSAAPSEQGWMNNAVICAELGMEETHLNVQIYRIRNQVNKALKDVSDVSDFIQRRSGSIRLGADALGIKVNKVCPSNVVDSVS